MRTEAEIRKELDAYAAVSEGPYTDHLTIAGDCMVTSDWHLPGFSALCVDRMLAVAKRFRIPTLAIVGDFLNMNAFKKFDAYRDEGKTEPELECARGMLELLASQFQRIAWCLGNHEARLLKHLMGRFGWDQIFAMLGVDPKAERRIDCSDYRYMVLDDEWLLPHPKNYSQISSSVARRLAEKFHKHILNTHGHFIGSAFDRSGKFVVADIGGMFDIQHQDYVMYEITTHPNWNGGFAMIRRGALYLFSMHPARTDWDFWLKETEPNVKRRSRLTQAT